jgi:type I restriction enzyme S subunit
MTELLDSAVPWIGFIPSNWTIKPLFTVALENKAKNSGGEKTVLSLSYGRIIRRNIAENTGLLPESFDSYQELEPGYIIIRSTDLQNDKRSLRVGLVEDHGIITSAYIGLTPRHIQPKFLFYFLNMCDLKKVFYSLGGGLRQSLRFEDIKRFPIPIPPEQEQQLISRYLDKKTAQIDSLIEKIEKKIELLKEQRTSLINQCVTKGLDPNVEMKDSGVEWIGKIPKHWTVLPLKRLFVQYFGGSWGDDPKEDQLEDLVRVIRVTEFDMSTLRVKTYIPTVRSLSLGVESEKLVRRGDLIIEKSGGGEKTPVGRVVLVDQEFKFSTINSNFTNIGRLDLAKVNPVFSVFTMFALYSQGTTVRNIKQTTGIQNLDLDGFMMERAFLPPIEEQAKIAVYLDEEQTKFYKLSMLLRKNIELLQEYRQSLISSVVTGKIRVTEDMV